MDDSLYYNIKDIMKIFNIGKDVAYKLAQTDGIPCMRLGNRLLFEKSAFETWRKRNLNKTIILSPKNCTLGKNNCTKSKRKLG